MYLAGKAPVEELFCGKDVESSVSPLRGSSFPSKLWRVPSMTGMRRTFGHSVSPTPKRAALTPILHIKNFPIGLRTRHDIVNTSPLNGSRPPDSRTSSLADPITLQFLRNLSIER